MHKKSFSIQPDFGRSSNVRTVSIAYIFSLIVVWQLSIRVAAGQSPRGFFTAESYTINANIEQPFRTGIQIGFNDYVYIEALGKIGVGLFYGETYPIGMIHRFDNPYSKDRSMPHGALMWQIGPGSGYCHKLFLSSDDFVKNVFMVSKARMVIEDGQKFVPGDYFLSQYTGELTLDVNDNETQNNWGSYAVRVFVVKQYYHINRNLFNRCPQREPKDGAEDADGNKWIREWPNSWYYHGFNNSYRGFGVFAGCQCVYDQGKLLRGIATDPKNDPKNNQGTFDYGFWMKPGGTDNAEATHLHMILDVLPHDLWVKQYGGNDRLMRYSPSQVIYTTLTK